MSTDLKRFDSSEGVHELDVPISYEIISLFSEGLYKSPHKAIEELVVNGFDAGANSVSVLLPQEVGGDIEDALWIIDDGDGMDSSGFSDLWLIAESRKREQSSVSSKARAPIGQFGIGKLAAYVLAWRMTHVSRDGDGTIRLTSMNFRRIGDYHQNSPERKPLSIWLHELPEDEAKVLLAGIEDRDPVAWDWLFNTSEPWTAVALTDFRGLYDKLQGGTLGWVLRTALPRVSDFSIRLNGEALVPASAQYEPFFESEVGGDDSAAEKVEGVTATAKGITIEGIDEEITGVARLYERVLPQQGTKASELGRSNGFFVRVRGRVINLEDPLFGLEAQNHQVWSRFALDLDADGLHEHLLSSREGVKGFTPVYLLREYLRAKFNECRSVYNRELRPKVEDIDLAQLLANGPNVAVTGPLSDAVREVIGRRTPTQYLYFDRPEDIDPEQIDQVIEDTLKEIETNPFRSTEVQKNNRYGKLARYDIGSQSLLVNEEHPFLGTIHFHAKDQTPAMLVAGAEVLLESILRRAPVEDPIVDDILNERDMVLRFLVGEAATDAREVLQFLKIANQDELALERAVGMAFDVIGFSYTPKGGYTSGADGLLEGVLGFQGSTSGNRTFRLVYDAKTTSKPAVPHDKVKLSNLWRFMREDCAEFGFFIAKRYDGQDNPESTLNEELSDAIRTGKQMSLMTIDQLRRLLSLHLRYGVSIAMVREIFETARHTYDFDNALDDLKERLSVAIVPLQTLLYHLEELKTDIAQPNLHAVRMKDRALVAHTPGRLAAYVSALQELLGDQWIEIDESSLDVTLHSSPEQIERQLSHVLGELSHELGE